MIDLTTCNEWQHRDPETGLVLPWYTKSFLDELVTWDLSDKAVFEFGCGASTLWWSSKMPVIYGAESNHDYWAEVNNALERIDGHDWYIVHDPEFNNPFGMFQADYHPTFEVIVVDCEPVTFRDKCITIAINHLSTGGKLIIDNWDQPSVWVPSDETRALITALPHTIYKQDGHPDWQTLVATKPKEIEKINLNEVSLLPNGEYGIGFTY